MDALALLRQAGDAGLTVHAEDGKLVVRGPKQAESIVRLLAEHKPEVLAAIHSEASEERAAIIEEGAGVPREWAEGFARLCIMPRPDSVPPGHWQRLIDNAGRFIDRFAAQAHGLGWDAASVFGCHAAKPDARLDMQGLVWLIGDGELVAITATTARIRTRAGGTLTYRRQPRDPREPLALAWELAP